MRKFCTAAASLDNGVIAALLEEKMGAPEWQRRLKALALVEALVKEEDSSGRATPVRNHFTAVHPVIEAQLNSVQASLKEKARKVLDLLGLGDGAPPLGGGGGGGNGSNEPNLFDMGGPEQPAAVPTPPPPEVLQSPSDNLFADLDVSDPNPPPVPTMPAGGGGGGGGYV